MILYVSLPTRGAKTPQCVWSSETRDGSAALRHVCVSACAAYMRAKIGKKPVKEEVGEATAQFPEREKQATATDSFSSLHPVELGLCFQYSILHFRCWQSSCSGFLQLGLTGGIG